MHKNYFLWIVGAALACLLIIFWAFWYEINSPVTEPLQVPIALRAPYSSYISGSGVVETCSGNIALAPPTSGRLVDKVLVREGDSVEQGSLLLVLEHGALAAQLQAQQVAYRMAVAKLKRLESLPRPEEAAAAEAALKSAQAHLESTRRDYEMVAGLGELRAISQEEKNRRWFQLQEARGRWLEQEARWKQVTAGSWEPDLQIAQLEVEQAEAQLKQIEAELEKSFIRSPIEGKLLQMTLHPGEAFLADRGSLIVGNTEVLCLRVAINQLDIPRFEEGAQAVAFLEGDNALPFPLQLVRVVPYLVAKQELTHQIREKVDTRVMQLLYRLEDPPRPLMVGQRMDVFIQARPQESRRETQPNLAWLEKADPVGSSSLETGVGPFLPSNSLPPLAPCCQSGTERSF